MLIAIPDVLDTEALARVRDIVLTADWIDGNATSGAQSALAKRNRQLSEDSDAARSAGAAVLDALAQSALFVAAALPLKVFPPLFNQYEGGEAFGAHVDTAVRIRRGSDFRVRADLSATLFLDDPASYDGGALVIEERFGEQRVKLPAGHMVVYPASSIHRVEPVTRGRRTAAFFWIQSMIPRRWRAAAVVRPRQRGAAARRQGRAGGPRHRRTDRRLSQPPPPVGGLLTEPA